MGLYQYGAKPPVTHFSAWKFAAHPAAAVTRPRQFDAYAGPASVLLEDDNQDRFGACVGFATAQIVRHVLAKAGSDDPGQLSPWWVWDLTRQLEGDLTENNGVDPHDALTIVRNQGICRLDLMPDAGSRMDALPSQAAIADAATRTGIEFYQAQTVDELLTGMGTLGVPGDLCIAVYADFETPNPDGTIGPPTGAVLGYHDVQLRSYDDDTQTAVIHNQWPHSWRPDNEITVTYAQLGAIWSQGYVVTHPAIQPVFQPDPNVEAWLAWQQGVADYLPKAYVAGAGRDTLQWQSSLALYAPQISRYLGGWLGTLPALVPGAPK